MAPPNLQLQISRSPIRRYGLAVVSFAIALGMALLAQSDEFRNVEVPLFLFAVAVTAWYAGSGPAALNVALSIGFFDYFFTEPRYTMYVSVADLPYMTVFISFAMLVAWFSAVRRRVERELVQARDHLQIEVAERTQQASLLNLTHDSIFVRDMDFVITYWNRGAHELYGWTPEEATGKGSQDLLHTTFPAPLDEILEELLRTGRWEGELVRTRADGTEVIVASRWSLRREQDRPVAILETSNDITERKRREEEITRLNQELARRSIELEGTNKELEAFAYSVSHDLRAPLRHMAGYTELLQKRVSTFLDEKGVRYMAMILESAKRMGSLIDDLLAFSRIGRAETRKTLISLEQLAREALMEVKQETEGREIVWKVGELPSFYGDRSMLRLALVNLISNAVKFTRTRPKAEIEIGTAHGTNEREVVVFVRDNGVGFDMKYVNKLFGVFQRLHRSDAFEGTGIGLATVQRIIHRHGGRVWAEGFVDRGATFYFSTPKP